MWVLRYRDSGKRHDPRQDVDWVWQESQFDGGLVPGCSWLAVAALAIGFVASIVPMLLLLR